MSTHQIARPGVVQLHRWGLLAAVLASGAPAIRQVSFTAAGETVRRTVKDKAGVDLLVAPRRYILDTHRGRGGRRGRCHAATPASPSPASAATRPAGPSACTATTASGAPVEIDARFVVGADGLASRVARAVGAEFIERRGRRRRRPVRVLRRGAVARDRAVRRRPGAGRGVPDPRRRGLHLGRVPVRRRPGRPPPCRLPRRGVHRPARAAAPELADRLRTGRRVSPVAGMLRMPNHLRRGPRPRLGTGRRRRLPPRRGHRPRPERRLPGRRAARRRRSTGAVR